MDIVRLWSVGAALLLLSACDVLQSARNDFSRLGNSSPFASHAPAPSVAARSPAAPTKATTSHAAAVKPVAGTEPLAQPKDEGSPQIVGRNEGQLRSMLGAPTTVEDHAPGKTWRYRDGQCTYNVQLYPDVQTRQFGTLAYEVKSDDNSDEGNRGCLAQLRTRTQSGG